MTEPRWKSTGVLEFIVLLSIEQERWVSWVQETDVVLLINGGDSMYLSHWMRESGLAARQRPNPVWGADRRDSRVGSSHRKSFVHCQPALTDRDTTLGVATFSIFP